MSRMTHANPATARAATIPFLPNDGSEDARALTPADQILLFELQQSALRYFVENQARNGLILDRQANRGPHRADGLCSLTATGMGCIGLALASAPPYHVLTRTEAVRRIEAALHAALTELPHERGVMPHFVDSVTNQVVGVDYFSTIESAWLAVGGLWAAAFLGDAGLQSLADRLYDRIDFNYWTAPDLPDACGLLRHGMDRQGEFLRCCWDRLNGETVFMYVLGAGAAERKALSPSCWPRLQHFRGEAGGLTFNNADLGLFVFQYGLDLLDARQWLEPGGVDLVEDARLATVANERTCRSAAATYRTYRTYWGLSAGDGPGDDADAYRCYSPAGPIDGTAHLTATVASLGHTPGAVLENLKQMRGDRKLEARGRYGFSNVHCDRNWVSRDMIGIDVGAAILAVDNVLMEDRVRRGFHELPCVQRGLQRLSFRQRGSAARSESRTEQRQAG